MNIKNLLLLIPLLALTACSSDDGESDDSGNKRPASGVPIDIEVSEAPLSDPEGAGTRAAITYKNTLSRFYMKYLTTPPQKTYTEANASRTDADHKWETDAQWPSGVDADTPCYFYAYANVDYEGTDYSDFNYNKDTNYSPDGQSLDFSIDELTNGQMDLLVATQTMSQNENQTQHKPVHFQFHHACAALQFSICKTEALSAFNVRVEKVVLHNIKKHGTYNFSNDSWSVNTDVPNDLYANYTLASSTPMTVTTAQTLLATSQEDYMFVIPQTVNKWDRSWYTIETNDASGGPKAAYLEIKCSIIKGEKDYSDEGSVYLPFGDTWKMSMIHRYVIRMGTNLRDRAGWTVFTNTSNS